ncbi:MAG: NAD-binding protein [Deltaproteobacteria bacterium]|nr:NAD-binding protein [Deltaproteobacteria bacterium]
MKSTPHLRFSFLVLICVVLAGTLGYSLIEGWGIFESFYMTIITITTVGFREVHELSSTGKAFTIVLIFSSLGVIAYAGGSFVEFIVEGQIRQIFGRKKLQKEIDKLVDHFIICGYGRIGSFICAELKERPIPFVVVENDPNLCQKIEEEGYLFVAGDATDDDALVKAGIAKAKGLVTAVTQDTDNVYITLTARGLNPALFILARAAEPASEKKLKRAGASKVVSPYLIGAHRMAQAILRPSVVDFLEIATAGKRLELQLEEIKISSSSSLVGKNLITSGIRRDWGIIIVGIKKINGQMLFNPVPETIMENGDTLITLGEKEAIVKLEKIA